MFAPNYKGGSSDVLMGGDDGSLQALSDWYAKNQSQQPSQYYTAGALNPDGTYGAPTAHPVTGGQPGQAAQPQTSGAAGQPSSLPPEWLNYFQSQQQNLMPPQPQLDQQPSPLASLPGNLSPSTTVAMKSYVPINRRKNGVSGLPGVQSKIFF